MTNEVTTDWVTESSVLVLIDCASDSPVGSGNPMSLSVCCAVKAVGAEGEVGSAVCVCVNVTCNGSDNAEPY